MTYTLKTVNSGFFGDTEKWINTQVFDEENQLVSEEIWTHEGQNWELKDIHVGELGVADMKNLLFKEHENHDGVFALLNELWQNRAARLVKQVSM